MFYSMRSFTPPAPVNDHKRKLSHLARRWHIFGIGVKEPCELFGAEDQNAWMHDAISVLTKDQREQVIQLCGRLTHKRSTS